MNFSIFVALAALAALPILIGADLMNNQLDEGYPFRYSRPSSRARYTVKSCRPCGQNECQVMGMQRFAEPRCEAFSGLGSPCRMWQEPENKTLSFPNTLLYCNDVYMQFCPCARGLVCHEAECKRAPRQQMAGFETHSKRQSEREERDGFDVEEEEIEEDMPISFEPGQSRFPWAVARFH